MSSTKSFAPERFHRHAFVWFAPEAADAVSAEREVLSDWLGHGRPLVVRRPCLGPDGRTVCVGLALPPASGKRRVAFDLPLACVRKVTGPPVWEECRGRESETARQICERASACGISVRAFGSHAWQHLTGLSYLTPASDIDLLLFLSTRADWEPLRLLLAEIDWEPVPRIDLEIVLENGDAFQWREFTNASPQMLLKGNSRVRLADKSDFLSGSPRS